MRCKRADDWAEYSLFLFARHPTLQPKLDSPNSYKGESNRLGLERFETWLSDYEKRIETNPQVERVIKDFSNSQRKQLAALILDTKSEYENYTRRRQAKEWSRRLGKEGPRRQRMLIRKVKLAHKALLDLNDYAKSLDPSIGATITESSENALRHLSDPQTIQSLELLRALSKDLREFTKDPTHFSMVKLYWFFRTECNLSGHESEVRVALIRNTLWAPLGVQSVNFLPEYQSPESQGCQAVHEAVRRFRSPRGTTA
jgi:hypothetical protein